MSLSWNLASTTNYSAGAELNVQLSMLAVEAGTHYIIGALYAKDGSYLPGTMFGIVVPESTAVGVISYTDTNVWYFEAGEGLVVPAKLSFNRTDIILSLFLMKMSGETAFVGSDVVVAQVSTALGSPASTMVVFEQILPVLLMTAFFSMIVSSSGINKQGGV